MTCASGKELVFKSGITCCLTILEYAKRRENYGRSSTYGCHFAFAGVNLQQVAESLEVVEILRSGHSAGKYKPFGAFKISFLECHIGFDGDTVCSRHLTFGAY